MSEMTSTQQAKSRGEAFNYSLNGNINTMKESAVEVRELALEAGTDLSGALNDMLFKIEVAYQLWHGLDEQNFEMVHLTEDPKQPEKTINDLNLTEMERKALQALIDGLYAEPGYSDMVAEDIEAETGIPGKKLRGVLSSLVRKGIISIPEQDINGEEVAIIYLRDDYYYLHPEWAVM